MLEVTPLLATVSLHATEWRDGMRGQRSEPRKIYGCDTVTLLVGRVYVCTRGHDCQLSQFDILLLFNAGRRKRTNPLEDNMSAFYRPSKQKRVQKQKKLD